MNPVAQVDTYTSTSNILASVGTVMIVLAAMIAIIVIFGADGWGRVRRRTA
ncbi:hypothetical protein [Cutibacterium avidum]|uniref:hypothetical protein n=1 Tax=Cutibacterium avidum TaxID=33010 RepID=UPI002FF22ECC